MALNYYCNKTYERGNGKISEVGDRVKRGTVVEQNSGMNERKEQISEDKGTEKYFILTFCF